MKRIYMSMLHWRWRPLVGWVLTLALTWLSALRLGAASVVSHGSLTWWDASLSIGWVAVGPLWLVAQWRANTRPAEPVGDNPESEQP